jgi:hypothetical protein
MKSDYYRKSHELEHVVTCQALGRPKNKRGLPGKPAARQMRHRPSFAARHEKKSWATGDGC